MGETTSKEALDVLLVRTAAGDRGAFRALYQATSGKLFAVLIRVLGDDSEASDVLQEVYISVWKRAGHYDPVKGRALSWLAVIARNAGIDALRRRRPGRVSEDFCDEQSVDEETSFHHVLAGDAAARIVASLGRLPAPQRDAVKLFYLEEKSLAEIAEQKQAPVNTVKSWVRRGIANLRLEFQDASIQEYI